MHWRLHKTLPPKWIARGHWPVLFQFNHVDLETLDKAAAPFASTKIR